MADKKQLKEQYKNSRPDMGVFRIQSRDSGYCALFATKDLKSRMNRFRFELGLGLHPDKDLQREWKEKGAENFIMDVLERLDYDKDPAKTDYGEELELLRDIWQEKLAAGQG